MANRKKFFGGAKLRALKERSVDARKIVGPDQAVLPQKQAGDGGNSGPGEPTERKRFHQPAPADRRKEEKYLITLTLGYSVVPPPWVLGPKRELP